MLCDPRTILGAILCCLTCACGGGGASGGGPPPPPARAVFLYVTNESAGSLDVLTLDPTTGIPTAISGSPLPEGTTPRAIAVDPQKGYLYVVSSAGEVRGYVLDFSSGTLTAIGGSPFLTGGESVAIAVDPGGQFVLTANGTSNSVSVFRIGSTGALAEVAGSPFAAGADPESLVVTPGDFVYAGNAGGGSVSAYSMSSGSLTPVAGSPFPVGGSPQELVVDPAGTHLYAADSQPSGVSGLAIDPGTGALTGIPGSPFAAPNGALSVVMDGAGKLLHVANGTNVDCYSVDATSGALTYIGPSVTNGRAVALAVDAPDGFLYALDNVDNQIEVFSIDAASYGLTLIAGNPYALFPGSGTQSLGASSITVVR